MASIATVTEQLAGTTMTDVPVIFAAKKPAGNIGAMTEIKTNLTKMTLAKNIPFYKYDVRMYALFERDGVVKEKELTKQTRDDFPEQERKVATVAIYKKLLVDNASFFGDVRSVFYDRAAILFSLKLLNIQGEEKEFSLPAGYVPFIPNASGFKAVLKKCSESFQASTNDIQNANNARAAEQNKTLLEALNLICGQTGLLDTQDFVTYGNGLHYCIDPFKYGFTGADFPGLPDSKYLGGGAQKSVKVLEGTEKGMDQAYVFCERWHSAVTQITPMENDFSEQSLCMLDCANFSSKIRTPNAAGVVKMWKNIASDYLGYIRKALFELSPNYKPKITAIAVSKQHSERLFRKKITGTNAAQQNIAPGSIVDTVIVNSKINEFYLNSHSAFQGTAKTPKYSVIVDVMSMPNDDIELLTHGLCYCHGIVNMTVSLPAPLMVADRCATRGHNVYVANDSNSSMGGPIDLPAANGELTNQGKRLGKVRYNA